MRTWIRTALFVTAGVVLAGACVVTEVPALVLGVGCAILDGAWGRTTIKTLGTPIWVAGEYERLLRDRHGIQVDRVAGRVVWPFQDGFARGYNAVSEPWIRSKFGASVFEDCIQEALEEEERRFGVPRAGLLT
jgi:hypothetical protein